LLAVADLVPGTLGPQPRPHLQNNSAARCTTGMSCSGTT
jgi:hypothetical protein